MSDPIELTINGKAVVAEKGELLIDAAERSGIYIPRFCYHERMRPVGMCRMCIVEVDTGRGPALQPSCMLECTPGMSVDTQSDVTKKAQDGVLEFLLVNHPLDCPVCDKGGECPLQDQTVSYGPGESRFVEEKRHYEKPIAISDLVFLDRERCILCDRCTRFADEVAGDPLIHFMNRGNGTEINTFPHLPFASYFSGNTVQICPVGALTSSSYRFKARPWDLDEAESTCTTCAVGCRIAVQTSRNEVLRYQGVDIDSVNWGWLCDKGRFGAEAVNNDMRLSQPMLRTAGAELKPTRWSEALAEAARVIGDAIADRGPDTIGVIGGARLTNEDAYAWTKFTKGVLGTDNLDAQLHDGLPGDLVLGLPKATIDDVCAPGGTVVLLAPDLKEELPVLYLRLRDAAVNHGVKILEISSLPTGMSKYATLTVQPRPGEIGAVAAAIASGAVTREVGGVEPMQLGSAAGLLTHGSVTVVLGRPNVAEGPTPIVDAASALLHALPGVRFLSALRRGNVHGALDMGMAPGLLPGHVRLDDARTWSRAEWPHVPASQGLDARDMLQAAADGKLDVLILLGVDLADFPDRDLADRAIEEVKSVIALDTFLTGTSSRADVVFPVAGPSERSGTTTNIEGRVSLLGQAVTSPGTAQADWIVAAELTRLLGADLGLESLEQIRAEIERVAPSHAGLTDAVLTSPLGGDGIVVPLADPVPFLASAETSVTLEGDDGSPSNGDEAPTSEAGIPRPTLLSFDPPEPTEPAALDSYSLRLVAGRKLYDQGTTVQFSRSLAALPAGTTLRINPYDFDRLGIAAGDTVRVASNRAAATIEAVADPDVPLVAATVLHYAQANLDVATLLDAHQAVTDLRVETT